MKALKPFWGVLVVVGVVAVLFGVATVMQPKEIIQWRTDFAVAQEEAQTNKKPLFVYFTADWCGPCKAMAHTTWADPRIDAQLRAYVPVKVNVDQYPEMSAKYTMTEEGVIIPTMVVLDLRNRVVKKHSGALIPDEFLTWMATADLKETSDLER